MIKYTALVLTLLVMLTACRNNDSSSDTEDYALDSSPVQESSQSEDFEVDLAPAAEGSEDDSVFEESPPEEASPSGENVGDAAPYEAVKVTIPEGYTLARIGMTLKDLGICTTEEFIKAATEGDYSEFPLVNAIPDNPEKCFKLEGYLYPDTYQFFKNAAPEDIIRTMLRNTESKISEELRLKIKNTGYTIDEIIILASIIEKEAFTLESMGLISSVLHNRLDIGMRLQCDVTIKYVEGAIKPFIPAEIENKYNSFYNTYKCDALPAGAICNPGINAIKSAAQPAESDYLFFVTDKDLNYYFSADFEEHKVNVKKAEA